ncbi:aminopeptidase N-like [Liolophura sinensis]|uniref:aminopeptidase N-like n=1 Tax=Liolophura sinensis TaxID=3198878 RepID=UPI0031593E0C
MATKRLPRELIANDCEVRSYSGSSHPANKTGCHVTTATGVALVLLAVGVATLTGLIVYLAVPDKTFKCQCVLPDCSSESPPPAPKVTVATDSATTFSETTPSVTTPSVTKARTEVPLIDRHMRLPRSLLPVHYRVELEPRMYGKDPKNFTFRGSVDILVDCVEASDNITLNMFNLMIVNSSITLLGTNGMTTPRIHGYQISHSKQLLILNLDDTLTAGSRYHVIMEFSGPLRVGWRGLYVVEYTENNSTTYVTGTQLATVYARKVFPCFDEPAFKATFDLTVVRRNDHTALSNTPLIKSERRANQMTADTFDTTPKMSTYNLALVVSQFANREAMTSNRVKIRVWTRPELLGKTDYVLRLAVYVLDYFEEFYRIRYSLPKLDMVALTDFVYGGMENWGLILYDEKKFLVEPGVTSTRAHELGASIISHEIVHQWFGNLLTMEWWDDIWLNEGFADFFHNTGVNSFHPDWKMHQLTIVNQLQDAFNKDNRKTSHPLKFPVDTLSKIRNIYDSLPYVKGASILRMFQHFLGEDAFLQAIRSSDHGVPVRDILATWLFQMNYPVVTVKRSANHSITVSQKRFVLYEKEEESETFSSPYGYKWDIPFTFTTNLVKDFNTSRTTLLWWNEEEVEICDSKLIPVWSNNSWVIGNVRQVGFYRVNYEADNWDALIGQLKEDHVVFSVENRAQIVNDVWNFVRSGLLDAETALNASQYLQAEESYIPWRAVVSEFQYACHMLSQTTLYPSFQMFMRSLLRRQYFKTGWGNKQNHLDSLFQNLILTQACHYGIPECVTKAKKLFSAWMKDDTVNPVPMNYRDVVYCTAIAHGDLQEWDFAVQMYQKSNESDEQERIISALGCTTQPWIILKYLSWSLRDDSVLQRIIVRSMAKRCSTENKPLLWRYIQEHWEKLSGGTKYMLFKHTFQTAFNTDFDLRNLKRFIGDYTGAKDLEDSIVTTQSNIEWMKNNFEAIGRWFDEHGYGA